MGIATGIEKGATYGFYTGAVIGSLGLWGALYLIEKSAWVKSFKESGLGLIFLGGIAAVVTVIPAVLLITGLLVGLLSAWIGGAVGAIVSLLAAPFNSAKTTLESPQRPSSLIPVNRSKPVTDAKLHVDPQPPIHSNLFPRANPPPDVASAVASYQPQP